jgi:thiol:disulfide interchange protein/DsbC/DsbD-like thiol-disulfide interchange protein
MQAWFRLILFSWLALPLSLAAANNTEARLILSAETARPGETILAGVHLQMAPGWHTYWKNPGDSGGATQIEWDLPPGVTAGEVQWPVPKKHTEEGFSTFVYYGDTVLLVPLKLAETISPGPLEIKAKVSWLECEAVCIPGDTEVSARLTMAEQSKPSSEAALLEDWKTRLPQVNPELKATAQWGKASENPRRLVIEWETDTEAEDFFPYAAENYEIEGKTELKKTGSGIVRFGKTVNKFEGDWPEKVAGLLVYKTPAGERAAYEVELPVAEKKPAAGTAQSLWWMLLLGFVGGLILNVMPCVLPVLSLKILGLVNQAKEAAPQVRKLGLVYTGGVLASFMVLAGIVIAIQQAGELASWGGTQFQDARFLVFMTVLLVLVALNLFGVFEINIGGKALGTASALAGREGTAGAFFHGVLITALATPCTAPFLGAAVGFAFVQPPYIIVPMFIAIGLGLASPYLLLSFQPNLARFLPRPGPWMERFKVAMGFPLLATAVWLFWLTLGHFGPDSVLWFGLFLVVVALSAWMYGEFVQRGRRGKPLAIAAIVVLLAAGYLYALEKELQWRSPVYASAGETALSSKPGGIQWKRWSPEAVHEARAAGHPVLVDFTARWCQNCLVNKKTSIEIPEVRQKLDEIGAVAFIGDFTMKDPLIAAELRRHERAGVPLVLVYSPNLDEPPQILPELLRPSIVLQALDKAALGAIPTDRRAASMTDQ